jgi:hypothetical protein
MTMKTKRARFLTADSIRDFRSFLIDADATTSIRVDRLEPVIFVEVIGPTEDFQLECHTLTLDAPREVPA